MIFFDRVFGFLTSIYHLLQNFKSNSGSQKRQWNSQIFFSGCIRAAAAWQQNSSRSYHCCLLALNHVCILAYIECQCQIILIRKQNHYFLKHDTFFNCILENHIKIFIRFKTFLTWKIWEVSLCLKCRILLQWVLFPKINLRSIKCSDFCKIWDLFSTWKLAI